MFSGTALACFHNSNASTSRQLPAELSLTPLSPARPGNGLATAGLPVGIPAPVQPRDSSQGRALAASPIPTATWR